MPTVAEPPVVAGRRSGMTARRLAALGVLTLLAALATVLVGAPPALACSCVGFDDAAAFERADVVFTGSAIERRVRHPVTNSLDPATYVFVVESVHKGTAQALQEVVTAVSGASCGLEAQVGPRYVVFAERDGGVLRAGLCGGTRLAEPPLALGGTAPPRGADPVSAPEGGWQLDVGDGPLVIRDDDGVPLAAAAAAVILLVGTAAGTALALARRRGAPGP